MNTPATSHLRNPQQQEARQPRQPQEPQRPQQPQEPQRPQQPRQPQRPATFCLTSALYAPHIGGVENYTAELAHALTAFGHRVIVLTNRIDATSPAFHTKDGVKVVRIPCNPLADARYPIPRFTREYREMLAWVASQPIDYHVINTRFYPISITAARIARNQGVHPIVIEHGSAHLVAGKAAADAGVAAVEHAFTHTIRHYTSDFYGVSSSCCAWLNHFDICAKGVLPNSIDAQRYLASASPRDFRAECGIHADDFLVCFVGRYIPEKGVRQLIAAVRLLPSDSRIHVAFAGHGPLQREIRENTSTSVHELGALAPSDVAALLLSADAFCLPSRSEGFSTTLLETAACGTTPIITHVGGTDELIPDDRFGIMLESSDPACICNAIRSLAENRTLCTSMGARLQKRVCTDYSWEATARKTESACAAAQTEV